MKDDSARDKAIEKLVSEKLRKGAVASGAACPDAEILAAYVERALTPRERASWEIHFDACARCQMHIAELVRLGEADQAEAPALSPAPEKRAFGLRWAWAAPMLVALVVAGLWYTGEFNRPLNQPRQTNAPVRTPAPAPAKAPEAGENAAKKEAAGALAQMEKLETQKTAPARNELRQAPGRDERRVANAPASQERRSAEEMSVALEGASAREEETESPAPPPLTAAKPETRSAPAALADKLDVAQDRAIAPPSERARLETTAAVEGGGASSGASGTVAGGLKAAPESRDESGPESATVSAALVGARSKAIAVETQAQRLTAPSAGPAKSRAAPEFHYTTVVPHTGESFANKSAASLWRVGPHGTIQKSASNGGWENKTSGITANLFDIVFAGPEKGWVVGQSGMILRSTDGGETWQKISSPTDEDLVHVTASSDQSAQVTARTGRIYSTTDGGATWRAVSSPK